MKRCTVRYCDYGNVDIVGGIGLSPTNPTNTASLVNQGLAVFCFAETIGVFCPQTAKSGKMSGILSNVKS